MADFGIGAAILGSAALAGITGFIGNKSAAKAQSEAAQTAARATGEASEAAIAEQRRQYDRTRTDLAPYRQAGRLALGDLAGQIQTAPQGFQAGDEFKAPVTYQPGEEFTRAYGYQPGEEFTRAYGYQPGEEFTRAYGYDPAQFMTPELLGEFSNEGLEQDPGYQFRQAEGEKALQRGASAKGLSLSGGALKDLSRFNQGLASEEYGSAYGRYLDRYQSRVSDLLRRTELSRYGYETSQADLARRQSLGQYGYETSQADLARRQSLGQYGYETSQADLARRQALSSSTVRCWPIWRVATASRRTSTTRAGPLPTRSSTGWPGWLAWARRASIKPHLRVRLRPTASHSRRSPAARVRRTRRWRPGRRRVRASSAASVPSIRRRRAASATRWRSSTSTVCPSRRRGRSDG
jgi:hypothetical protein